MVMPLKADRMIRFPSLIFYFTLMGARMLSTNALGETKISFGNNMLRMSADKPAFNIRLARTSDIPDIRNCNLETLPENYTDEFYQRCLRTWPKLCLVAEKENRLIGYTLGRTDTERPPRPPAQPGKNDVYLPPVTVGHIASIAVYPQYRKMGVARGLMDMMHLQLAAQNVDQISLHCRVGNTQAIRLYSGHYPYQCVKVLPLYYDDDEDAWLMRLTGLQKIVAGEAESKQGVMAL